MATAIRAVSAVATGTGTAVAVSAPTGTIAGDVVLVFVTNNNTSAVTDNNGTALFALDAFVSQTVGNGSISMFSRRIQSGDPSTYNFTIAASQRFSGVAVTIQSPHAISIYDVGFAETHTTGPTVNTISAPSITTLNNNAIHFAVFAIDGPSNTTTGTPAGYTVRANGGQQLVVVTTKTITTAGATGTQAVTWTNIDAAIALSFAIRDSVSGVSLTIGGTDRSAKTRLNTLRLSLSLGSTWTADFSIRDTLSTAAAYRPTLGQAVAVTDGSTSLFSGTVVRVEDKPIIPPHIGTLTQVTARATSEVVDQIIVNETIAAGYSLHDVVSAIRATYLTAYGITLDPTMATGPTLEAQTFDGVTFREALNHLSTITGWLWRIAPNNELQMFAAGGKTASYSLTAANRLSVGPVTWEKMRERYVNSVYLRYGTDTQVSKTFTATGTGSISSWVLDYDAAVNASGYIMSRGLVTEGGADVTLSAPGGGGSYTWTAATNTLTRSAGNLGAAVVIELPYTAQFPQVILVEDSAEITANGKYQGIFDAPDIFEKLPATELAEGILRKSLVQPQWVHVSTRQAFVMPGDQITLTFADRTVSGAHIITEVRGRDIATGSMLYELTCLSGAEKQETWTDQLRSALGSGGARSSGGTISGSVIPNFSGRFDGDVTAHTGGILINEYESALSTFVNSGGYGPALRLGRSDKLYQWAIFADTQYGASPGTVARLRVHPTSYGSTIASALDLTEGTVTPGQFYVLPGANGKLYLGDFDSGTGIGAPANLISGIKTADIMATLGVYERSRTTRMGELTSVTFAAGNFAADNGANWTLVSGDVDSYAWSMVGREMTVVFELKTTTVANTPGYLTIDIPGTHTVAVQTRNALGYFLDNGVNSDGMAVVVAAETVIRIYRRDLAAFTNATNATEVRGQITFWCAEN